MTAVGINAIIGFAVVVLLHGLLLTNSSRPSVARWTPFRITRRHGYDRRTPSPKRAHRPGDWGFVDSFIGSGQGRRCWPSRITTVVGRVRRQLKPASAGRSCTRRRVNQAESKYTERAVVVRTPTNWRPTGDLGGLRGFEHMSSMAPPW
jgi:hypothetical protein